MMKQRKSGGGGGGGEESGTGTTIANNVYRIYDFF